MSVDIGQAAERLATQLSDRLPAAWRAAYRAYCWWQEVGSPDPTRFGMTVTRDRQTLWLDDLRRIVTATAGPGIRPQDAHAAHRRVARFGATGSGSRQPVSKGKAPADGRSVALATGHFLGGTRHRLRAAG